LSLQRYTIRSVTCPLALAIGTSTIIVLYLLCNLCYLRSAAHFTRSRQLRRIVVATLTVDAALPGLGRVAMSILIMVSTFGDGQRA